MAGNASAKGNPASKRMSNPSKKNKRINNKIKNEKLRAKGEHPKQLREKKQSERAKINKEYDLRHGRKWSLRNAEHANTHMDAQIPPRRIRPVQLPVA